MDPIPRLRAVLDHVGYRADEIGRRLGLDPFLSLRSADVPVYIRRLTDGDGLDTLIRMFLLHAPVDVRQLGQVIPDDDIPGLESVGILERDGDRLRSPLTILPHAGLLFAYDHHEHQQLRDDSVLGLTSSARTLAAMTVRRPVRRALDLGTGCGVQALLAARHAEHVVAVDINPRALWLTDLNCRLNGVTNVECRKGDLFEPVRGETFDLVVSNPPFVVSPATDYMFRDGGREGDAMSEAAVTGAAEALAEGGFATVMCNWVLRGEEVWWDRVARWVEGAGCDALLVHYDTLDPLSYAAAWNEYAVDDADAFSAALDRWLRYYAERHVDAVVMGAVILRRTSVGTPWVRPVKLGRGPSGSAGQQVQRLFAAQDVLAGAGDEVNALDQRFRGVDGHRVEQVLTYREGAYTAANAVIALDDGLGVQNEVEPQVLHVLLRLDGRRSVRELVAEIAEETGLDEQALATSATARLAELYGLGLVEREP